MQGFMNLMSGSYFISQKQKINSNYNEVLFVNALDMNFYIN